MGFKLSTLLTESKMFFLLVWLFMPFVASFLFIYLYFNAK